MASNGFVDVTAQSDMQEQLCGDDDLITNILQRFTDNTLVMPDAGKARAVYFRSIKKGTSVFVSTLDCLDAVPACRIGR